MVNKCSAYGCRSGYRDDPNAGLRKISFHSFPLSNPELRDEWVRAATTRKDFMPTKNTTICSLHFQPSDYVDEHMDKNEWRRKQANSEKTVGRRLKPGAIPSIFEEAPINLSKTRQSPKSTTVSAMSSSRQDREAERLSRLEVDLHAREYDLSSDTIPSLLSKLLAEPRAPQGFTTCLQEDKLFIYWLKVDGAVPSVASCVTVNKDLTVVASVSGIVIPATQFADLVTGPVQTLSQLINLMARIKSYGEDAGSMRRQCNIRAAIRLLQSTLDCMDESDDSMGTI